MSNILTNDEQSAGIEKVLGIGGVPTYSTANISES
jgi:hypothetical protein